MTKLLKKCLFLLAGALFSITVPAAPLPTLPHDGRILRGTLGCGVTYYMVTNPSAKGYADIAIVRRDEAPSSRTLESLDPAFFARMGIAPLPSGYVSDADGSTVIRYANLSFYRPEVLDSTLLKTFAQVAMSKAEQAVIVCGDIDPVELKKKMDIFSMLVPRILVNEAHVPDYVWEPSPAPSVIVNRVSGVFPSRVSVSYSSARIPQPLMNTAQALVTGIMGDELGVILCHRLRRNLKDAGVPFADMDFSVTGSDATSSDERYTISVSTSEAFVDAAMRTIATTLAEMDSFGVKTPEFREAKSILLPKYLSRAASVPSRSSDVDRCIAHFLYGAPLAPYSERSRLFARKNVPDSIQARHFNNFTGALVEQLSNLTLEYSVSSDSLDRDDALFYYNLAYLYGSVSKSGKNYTWNSADTLGMELQCPKVKLTGEKAEPVTGGKIWTFSNGIRVAFKQIPGSGMISYAYVLGGGLSRVEGLTEGEGGYIADLLSLYDAGGLSASAFHDMVQANGVDMHTSVQMNTMALYGTARSNKLPFLVKTIATLANDRNFNWGDFGQYSASEALRPIPVEHRLSRMLSPGFRASKCKAAGVLSAETCRKAERFYEERFSRMNDGMFIISGDIDEIQAKKILSRTLGALRTVRVMGTPRVQVDYRPLSGTRTVAGNGAPKGIYVLMDAEYPLTAQNFYTSLIAREALRQSLVRHLAPYGFTVDVRSRIEAQPQERFSMMITCTPASRSGLSPSIGPAEVERALSAVRAAIRNASRKAPSAADLNAWRQRTLSDVQAALSTPDGCVKTLVARYGAGKDITSRYVESIGSVNQEVLMSMLKALGSGGRIEYIVDE